MRETRGEAEPNGDSGVLAGGGETGALLRAVDWASTPLGPADGWPRSLRIALRIMLSSRQPFWIGWGPELIFFYNDAYRSIIGGKHPWALGRPTREVWREIWPAIGPMLDQAMGGTTGTYVEEQLLIMERNGYPEETYYTFSYSPIPNEDGSAGGVICANTEDTQRVIGERQLALLSALAAANIDTRSYETACRSSVAALGGNRRDLTFALLFMADPQSGTPVLAGASGLEPDHPAARAEDGPWPLAEVLQRHELRVVDDLPGRVGMPLPSGDWPTPPHQAALLPIIPAGEQGRSGVLVVGLNPYRVFDEGYRDFLGLAAGQIAAAITNADAYEQERRRAEALAEIDRAKTLFFSNVSHEFRTPLTLMLGPLEEALAEAARPTERERLELVHRNGLRLLKLVNSLLEFSRIEAGRAQASFAPTDLAQLTAELASNFRSATERAGLTLTVDCPPLPEPVYVDRDLWEKIVLNLLSNAFKFTFEGGITVSLEDEGNRVRLTVRDTGTGIEQHEIPRLFERFHRIEGARGRSFEGSGIGLALVQELVNLHRGRIAVESEPGVGTALTVVLSYGSAHLPADRVREAEPSAPHPGLQARAFVDEALRWLPGGDGAILTEHAVAQGPAAAAERAQILLADDNADMRDYVARLLRGRHEVETVPDGEAALAALRRRRPDLLLSDVMMPRLDGYGLLRRIRDDEDLRDLPVLLLSARAGEEASVEGLSLGADDYLVKPFSARELVARVESALAMATMRRRMGEALRESEERFRNMADNSPVMIWTSDASGGCTFLSRSWYEFTGQAGGAGLGFGWLDAVHPEDRRGAGEIFRRAAANREAFSLEYRLRHRDGRYRWAVDSAAPWYGNDGSFLGYIGSVIDIAERKAAEEAQRQLNDLLAQRVASAVAERDKTEQQLRQAQKMEAVGKLTGGVAHDFNNLLQVIGGNLQLLGKELAGNERAERRLQNALAGVSRGSKLAAQLLAFGRRQPLAPKVVNLGRFVRSLDELLRRALGDGIEIETVVSAGLWNTLVDPSQVENALLNLAINARDAMNGHGRLTIEAGNAALDDDYAGRHDVRPGQYVMLAVTDTGCGMTQEVLEQAFEPFFTTKPEGQGTGLGLSMVYGFVKQSEGHVKIYSEPGQGTTVRLYLPRVRQDEDMPTSEVEAGPAVGGTETVLVVEDDEEVRSTVVDLLSDLGYRVLRAKDAQGALAIVESGVAIDLIFTDVVMPGPLRSPELARKARERLPEVAVLFTSGYTENAIVHAGRLDEGIDLLSKPYSREALARKVRQVLRNQQQRRSSAAVEARPEPPADRAAEQGLTVLLVEDDLLIRMATADMLAGLGHRVLEASDADEARALLEQEPVRLLLADVTLPGVSGAALALEARRRDPALAVVFASGHAAVREMQEEPLLADAVLLHKPYGMGALGEALRRATGDREAVAPSRGEA